MHTQCTHSYRMWKNFEGGKNVYAAYTLFNPIFILYVLLKALPPVCMKYTARDESRVANIARGEAECYICHKTLIKSCIYFHTNEVAVFSVFYCILHLQFLGHFNTFIE